MKLSDFRSLVKFEIYSDGEFETLGKCTDLPPANYLTYLENEDYLDSINSNINISCVITTPEFCWKISRSNIGIAVCSFPKYCFFSIHNWLAARSTRCMLTIGSGCCIAPSVLMSANIIKIGDNVTIEDYVVIKGNAIIGDNSIIRANSMLGSSSFENCRAGDGKLVAVDEVGSIVIGTGVEIGELSIIDNAIFPWDNTIIGDNSYVGPRSIIGHGCKISPQVTIKHGSIVCGFVTIGSGSVLSPGCIIRNRLSLSENSLVSLGAVVTKNIESNMRVSGNFAVEHESFIKYMQHIESM